MLEKLISEQELVENFSEATDAAKEHAVIVTKDGTPAFVLLSIENYDRLVCGDVTVYEAFSRNGLHGEAAADDLGGAVSDHEEIARAS